MLSMNVIGRSLTVRVTEALNLADSRTVRVLNAILRVAEHMNIDVHIWISIPCTAGCTWQRVNRARGFRTGDINVTKELIRVGLAVATNVIKIEGKVYWEWPETNDLWHLVDVQRFIDKWELKPVLIASSAVGMMLHAPSFKKEVYVKKRWKIVTNNSAFVAESQHLVHPPKSLCEIDFVQCCGKIAKQTARYTPEFARHFWQTIVPRSRRPVVVQSRCLETSDQKSCTHLAEQVRSLSKRTDTKEGCRVAKGWVTIQVTIFASYSAHRGRAQQEEERYELVRSFPRDENAVGTFGQEQMVSVCASRSHDSPSGWLAIRMSVIVSGR